MAKTMARIKDGVVVNVEWYSNYQDETETLKDPDGRAVSIGDNYSDGHWYHDGVEILTPFDEALAKIKELEAVNADQAAALDAIYAGVIK